MCGKTCDKNPKMNTGSINTNSKPNSWNWPTMLIKQTFDLPVASSASNFTLVLPLFHYFFYLYC